MPLVHHELCWTVTGSAIVEERLVFGAFLKPIAGGLPSYLRERDDRKATQRAPTMSAWIARPTRPRSS